MRQSKAKKGKGKGSVPPSEPPSPTPEYLPLCQVDERGFAIPLDDPRYDEGTTVFSGTPLVVVTDGTANLLNAFGSLFAGATAATGLYFTLVAAATLGPLAAAAVVAVAAIAFLLFAIASALGGTSEAEASILNELAKINEKLDILQQTINVLFVTLQRDIGDQTLDEIGNILDRISSSYQAYVTSAQLNSTSFEGKPEESRRLQASYRESFR